VSRVVQCQLLFRTSMIMQAAAVVLYRSTCGIIMRHQPLRQLQATPVMLLTKHHSL